MEITMKKQTFNPYMPSWEYVPDGEVLARVPTRKINFWEEVSAPITIPKGVHSLFFTYRGVRSTSLFSFEFI